MARGIKINSVSGALTVTLTGPSGVTPTVYSDDALTTTVALPVTVAGGGSQWLYVTSPGAYTLSVKTSTGVQIADQNNTTRLVDLESPGSRQQLDYDARLTYRIAGSSGTSGDVTADGASYVAVPDPALSPDRTPVLNQDGTVGWSRREYVHVDRYTGYDGTGATDSTAAFTAAIAAAQTSGVKRIRFTGTPKVTGLVFPQASGGYWLLEGDNPSASQLKLSGTGTLISNGSDDAAAVDANDYSGPADLTIRNCYLGVVATDTALGNASGGQYAANTTAIQDWRGGNIKLEHVRIFNFDTPFAGISSDLNEWDDVEITYAHSYSRLYSRSDQMFARHVKWFYCDRTWDVDSVVNTIFDHLQVYGCGVPFAASTFTDLVTDGTTGTVTSATATFTATDVGKVVTGTGIPDGTIIQSFTNSTTVVLDNNTTVNGSGGTLNIYRSGAVNPIRVRSSSATRQAGSVTFREPLFETSSLNPGNFEAFVEVGIGDTLKSIGVYIERPTILTDTPAGGHHMSYVVKVDNADQVVIDDPIYWNGGGPSWMDGLFLLVGATASGSHRARYKVPANAAGRRACRAISTSTASPLPRVYREVYGHSASSSHPGAYRGIMITDTIVYREAPSSDGALYMEIADISSGSTGFRLVLGGGLGTSSGFVNETFPGTRQWLDTSNNVLMSLVQQNGKGLLTVAGLVRSRNAQTLAANGAVTFDARTGEQQVTLNANATSSSITNPVADQLMRITWVQDGTGGRTYAWPANCKFAGGSAPSDTTVNRRSTVEFRYNSGDTSWYEVSRAVAVG